MSQPEHSGTPCAQNEYPFPSGNPIIPTTENIGKKDKPSYPEENNSNKNGGFKKWWGHLWSRDPDRQLELILACAIALFSLVQLVVTIANNSSTSRQVDKIITAGESIKDSARVFSGAAQGINDAGWAAVGRLQGQVDQVKRSADASTRTARIADETLHVSERAYIAAAIPTIDWGSREISMLLFNSGHIPSGKISGPMHHGVMQVFSTSDVIGTHLPSKPLYARWKTNTTDSIPPASGYDMRFPIPVASQTEYDAGKQQVVIVGTLLYRDGFPDTRPVHLDICFHSAWHVESKRSVMVQCDFATGDQWRMRSISQSDACCADFPRNAGPVFLLNRANGEIRGEGLTQKIRILRLVLLNRQ